MGYYEAMTEAGANVIEFKSFGSYQGTWLALVEYQGETGIVEGYYGSCSHCDAFQRNFDYIKEPREVNGKYYRDFWETEEDEITKEEYEQLVLEGKKKLSDFGKQYLNQGMNSKKYYQNLIEKLDPEDYFDEETREQAEWVLSLNF